MRKSSGYIATTHDNKMSLFIPVITDITSPEIKTLSCCLHTVHNRLSRLSTSQNTGCFTCIANVIKLGGECFKIMNIMKGKPYSYVAGVVVC